MGPAEKYQQKLCQVFPGIHITVTKKADSLFPIVSAASICAKVTRDAIIENWQYAEGLEFPRTYGSGYPSDPATKEWLVEVKDQVFGYPGFVRFSWGTCRHLLEDAIPVTWFFELI